MLFAAQNAFRTTALSFQASWARQIEARDFFAGWWPFAGMFFKKVTPRALVVESNFHGFSARVFKAIIKNHNTCLRCLLCLYHAATEGSELSASHFEQLPKLCINIAQQCLAVAWGAYRSTRVLLMTGNPYTILKAVAHFKATFVARGCDLTPV